MRINQKIKIFSGTRVMCHNVPSGTKVRTPLLKYIITSVNAALHRHWPDFMAPPICNDLMNLFDEVSNA